MPIPVFEGGKEVVDEDNLMLLGQYLAWANCVNRCINLHPEWDDEDIHRHWRKNDWKYNLGYLK